LQEEVVQQVADKIDIVKRQEVDLNDFLMQKAKKIPKNPSMFNAVS
jgi:hypothetical protein